jgi:hypothetical protein
MPIKIITNCDTCNIECEGNYIDTKELGHFFPFAQHYILCNKCYKLVNRAMIAEIKRIRNEKG